MRMRKRVSLVAVMVTIAMASACASCAGHRVRLPSDDRDEVLDADDDELRKVEMKGYGYKRSRENGEKPWVEQLSSTPRAFTYRNFLSETECEHVIGLAYGRMESSEVVDENTGEGVKSHERTSKGGYILGNEDEVVRGIELRIAAWAMLPPNRGENIEVLRYNPGEEYLPHHDYFEDTINTRDGGQRMATVLMYLSDVEEGGETVFPLGAPFGWSRNPHVTAENACAMARAGSIGVLSIKPRRGDAILFYSTHINGFTDQHSLHAGCPVIRGTKWTATQWLRVGPMHVGSFKPKKIETP